MEAETGRYMSDINNTEEIIEETDRFYMTEALKEARKAFEIDEVPKQWEPRLFFKNLCQGFGCQRCQRIFFI